MTKCKKTEPTVKGLSNFTSRGVPKILAKKLLEGCAISHDVEFKTTKKPRTASDLWASSITLNIIPSGAIAILIDDSGSYRVIKCIDNKLSISVETTIKNATKGMSVKGKFYNLDVNLPSERSMYRREKPIVEYDILAGSSVNIHKYMNKIFYSIVARKANEVLDIMYKNFRYLPKNIAVNGDELKYGIRNSRRDRGLSKIDAVEYTLKNCFRFEDILSITPKHERQSANYSPIGSYSRRLGECKDFLKNDPLARVKWAKYYLDKIDNEYNEYLKLLV